MCFNHGHRISVIELKNLCESTHKSEKPPSWVLNISLLTSKILFDGQRLLHTYSIPYAIFLFSYQNREL